MLFENQNQRFMNTTCPQPPLSRPFSALLISWPGLLGEHDIKEADTAPVEAESEEVKKALKAAQFPAIEGDTAPSAIVPKACASLSKQVTKIDGLIAQFVAASTTGSLSTLQTKNLVSVAACFCF